MKSILDPSFRYVNSTNTDLRRTFARVRWQLRVSDERASRSDAIKTPVVSLDLRRKSAA
ncbi:MAG: hypothetical protein ABI440_02530 [Casimicrobiaceae bacterium]